MPNSNTNNPNTNNFDPNSNPNSQKNKWYLGAVSFGNNFGNNFENNQVNQANNTQNQNFNSQNFDQNGQFNSQNQEEDQFYNDRNFDNSNTNNPNQFSQFSNQSANQNNPNYNNFPNNQSNFPIDFRNSQNSNFQNGNWQNNQQTSTNNGQNGQINIDTTQMTPEQIAIMKMTPKDFTKSATKITIMFFSGFFGICLFGAGLVFTIMDANKNWQPSSAVVIDKTEKYSCSTNTTRTSGKTESTQDCGTNYFVKYKYEVGGKSFEEVITKDLSEWSFLKNGDNLAIFVDAKNPSDSTLEKGGNYYLGMLGVGTTLLCIFAICYYLIKK